MQFAILEDRVQRLESCTTGSHCTPAGRGGGQAPLVQPLAADGKASSHTGWQAAPADGRAPSKSAGGQGPSVLSDVDGLARAAAAQPVTKQQQLQPLEPLAEDLSTSDLIAQLQGRYREAFAVLQTNREAFQNLGKH